MTGPIVLAMLVVLPLTGSPAGRANTAQPPAPGAQATAGKPWPPPGVFRVEDGVKPPVGVERPNPNYTAAAMAAKIAGRVVMEAVVRVDGTVGEVRVTRSLDRETGLDDEAVRTVKLWKFEPATKGGIPVPVLVVIEMDFALRKQVPSRGPAR